MSRKSFWQPYLDILPTSFSLPLFCTMEELELLAGSPTLPDVLKVIKGTIRQYIHMRDLTRKAGFPPLRYADFRWAIAIFMSRQNRIPAPGGGANMIALIPGWDCCNHRTGKIATYFNPEGDTSESFTMAPVSKGEPIYLYYGDRTNAKLFMFMSGRRQQ